MYTKFEESPIHNKNNFNLKKKIPSHSLELCKDIKLYKQFIAENILPQVKHLYRKLA